jgi:PEP-CTERM motif
MTGSLRRGASRAMWGPSRGRWIFPTPNSRENSDPDHMLKHVRSPAILRLPVTAGSVPSHGDFEEGTVTSTVGGFTNHGVPIGWTANAAFDEFYGYNSVEDSVVESGLHALQISDFDTEPLATLSQSFSDVPGDVYNVTFYGKVGVANRDQNAYLQVSVGSDGVTLHDDVPTAFQAYSFSFTGAGSDIFAIAAQNNPTFFYVDNISVTGQSVTASVPEPSTWAMMAIGFAMAGLVYRRRAQSALAYTANFNRTKESARCV